MTMDDIWFSEGKQLTYKNVTKTVKSVRTKYGQNLQIMFADDSIRTVTPETLNQIKVLTPR